MTKFLFFLGVSFGFFGSSVVNLTFAHPVPRSQHDRTIVVRLQPGQNQQVLVRVDYRLEVDEVTVARDDLFPFRDEVDYSLLPKKPLDFHAEFTRIYAPILAGNLLAKGNEQELSFRCRQRSQRLHDDLNQPLGHLRCDFVFEASFPIVAERENRFSFREGNYELQPGLILVSLAADPPLHWTSKTEAEESLQKRPLTEWRAGDEEKLRGVSGHFVWPQTTTKAPAAKQQETTAEEQKPQETQPAHVAEAKHFPAEPSLFQLLLRSEHGFWLLLLIAAGLGAVHALTPGHGKTLVAAYLVGQQGTIGHAIVLGLVTTMTHTGAVLILAGALHFLSEDALGNVQAGLGLGMGLLVACFGFYLLLQRLSGRADHIHIGGRHHHHHHHDEPGRNDNQPRVGWWGLIVLGMSGGIVPCTDAILMLFLAVGMNLLWLAVPLLLAFSAGLAGVLVLIGIVVVQVRNLAGSHWGEGRFLRSLPVCSAILVTLLGVWLCYESIQP